MVRLLKVPEACERLRIGMTKFYALVKRGEIRVIKSGKRCTRVPEREIERWIDRNTKAYSGPQRRE